MRVAGQEQRRRGDTEVECWCTRCLQCWRSNLELPEILLIEQALPLCSGYRYCVWSIVYGVNQLILRSDTCVFLGELVAVKA